MDKMKYNQKNIEKKVSERWSRENTPDKIVKFDATRKKFYLLDGPPYVNGIPHVGHIKTTTFKDVWGKFKYMQGYSVWFQPGFDCGGLPIENKVEKKLGIKTKSDIEKIGVDKFIEECKQFAKGNQLIWMNLYKNIGAWRGWLDPYLTSENYYLESGWWTIKQMFEKGFLVEGKKPGHWCPRCETILSGYEISDSYKNIEDPSIFVKFQTFGNEFLLIWTTTPWTLPSNVAVCVHPDEKYVKAETSEGILILAEKRLHVLDEIGIKYKIKEKFKGKKLEALKYKPVLDVPVQKKLSKNKNAHQVLISVPVLKKRIASKTAEKKGQKSTDEFEHLVTMDSGTGIVHIAPGHGEADNRIGKHYNLPEPSPVDEKGKFTEEAGEFKHMFVKDADKLIIEKLKTTGKLLHAEKITHSYPLCWRCKTPLIYRLSTQIFLKLDIIREKILKENKSVQWLPKFANERFINLINEAPDWAITRQRFWGIPLPVWICEKCGSKKIIGSVSELKKHAIQKIPDNIDLHKNTVDNIYLKCSECNSIMKRIPDTLDVWFDSGISPWASLGYPFKNKELFKKLWPVDLIDESQDQIRGWFYTLMLCSITTFNEKPYKTVCLNGWTLDEKAEKMSKSVGNMIMAEEAYEKLGADILRLYCCYDCAPWATQKFSLENAKKLSKHLRILWNTYVYFNTYASKSHKKPKNLMTEDLWILSRINTIIKTSTQEIEKFHFHTATRLLIDFIVNDFSRNYIKIIRDRKGESVNYTLTYVLEKITRLLAPFIPFITDNIYYNMFSKSVHECSYPLPDKKLINLKLEDDMKKVMQIIEASNIIRQRESVRLRWPLNELSIYTTDAENLIQKFNTIIKKMCNVLNIKTGKKTYKSQEFEDGIVYLDTQITPELKELAFLRELLRKIQEYRKKQNLSINSKIELYLDNNKLKKFSKEIMKKVLAEKIIFCNIEHPFDTIKIDNENVSFCFTAHKKVLKS